MNIFALSYYVELSSELLPTGLCFIAGRAVQYTQTGPGESGNELGLSIELASSPPRFETRIGTAYFMDAAIFAEKLFVDSLSGSCIPN
jgi:hypothetical protein